MNSRFQLSAKGWLAVGVVVAFYLLIAFKSDNLLATLLYAVVAISAAGIVAFDSTHIRLWHYKTWISYGPIGLFVVCALSWPVALVWYFLVRIRIARGTMPLRDEFSQPQATSEKSPWLADRT
jgi:hypothetical protein